MRDDIDRNSKDESDKRYDFFIVWKEKKGAEATYKALVNALLLVDCKNDAEYLCQKALSKPNTETTSPAITKPALQTQLLEPAHTASTQTSAEAASTPSLITTAVTTASTQTKNNGGQPSITLPSVTTSSAQEISASTIGKLHVDLS